MIGFDEASAITKAAALPLGAEDVALDQAQERILAKAVQAMVNAPPCDVSAMDGYAVRSADLAAVPVRLKLIGESFAGHGFEGSVGPGECVRIFTGAAVPAGADRVVIQENVGRDGAEALIDAPPGEARHVRAKGSDFSKGEILLPAGRRLDYRALVAAAGADIDRLRVWRRPRVALLATGDELAEPGSARDMPGKIPESISFGVLALARDWGGEPVGRTRLPDVIAEMEAAAAAAVENADLVIVTGGASVGEKDFARAMFEPLGLELLFSKVAMKPGKPVWLGRAGGTLVLGLPGNPTSALVTARLFLAPLVAGLAGGDPADALRWRMVPVATRLPACGDRETFVRARWNGQAAEPASNQDSSAQKALAGSDLLLRRRAHAEAVEAGALVSALDL